MYETIMSFQRQESGIKIDLLRKGKQGNFTWKIDFMVDGKLKTSNTYQDKDLAKRLFLGDVQTIIIKATMGE